MCRISYTSFFLRRWHVHLIHKGRIADPGVHQVDVELQRESGVGVAQPLRDLLHVAAGLEQQRGSIRRVRVGNREQR